MYLTGNSHPIVTRGFCVARAPPQHTLPAFLNKKDDKKSSKKSEFFTWADFQP